MAGSRPATPHAGRRGHPSSGSDTDSSRRTPTTAGGKPRARGQDASAPASSSRKRRASESGVSGADVPAKRATLVDGAAVKRKRGRPSGASKRAAYPAHAAPAGQVVVVAAVSPAQNVPPTGIAPAAAKAASPAPASSAAVTEGDSSATLRFWRRTGSAVCGPLRVSVGDTVLVLGEDQTPYMAVVESLLEDDAGAVCTASMCGSVRQCGVADRQTYRYDSFGVHDAGNAQVRLRWLVPDAAQTDAAARPRYVAGVQLGGLGVPDIETSVGLTAGAALSGLRGFCCAQALCTTSWSPSSVSRQL